MTTMTTSPTIKLPTDSLAHSVPALKVRTGRDRSGSLMKVEKVGESSLEQDLDQGAYVNINAEWVNRKGAWVLHPVLIFTGKIIIDTIPGMTTQISWTVVNLCYLLISYLVFHWATGIPFHNDLHSGAYDDLTLWEQIDEGAQYTPAKKWLITCPVMLFLLSTHYTHYDPWLFTMNLTALIAVLIPKLPQLHRQRVRFMTDPYQSGISTPNSAVPSGTLTPLTETSTPPILTEAHFD